MKRRLTVENRMLIEQLLKINYKLKDIAYYVDSTSSNVSREIKNRRITGKGEFKTCQKTNRFPYVCNGCELKTRCRKKKYYYNYIKAHNNYNYLLEKSRVGIDMSIDEIDYWNDYFTDKIKNKNQPITHLFNNIKNEFPKSIQTFYTYIHKVYFSSINDEMLPRAYSYKPRKRTNEKPTIRFDNVIRTGRPLKEMNESIENHPNSSIVEMHTVIDNFTKLFEVILTDNGWEFSKPEDIEFDQTTGEKQINIFYCEPYSSWQKGGIERNHEFIRYVIPKGITFDKLTKENIIDMMNNINNVSRRSLNYQTPYEIFNNIYDNEITKKLHLRMLKKDEVNLSYKLLIK